MSTKFAMASLCLGVVVMVGCRDDEAPVNPVDLSSNSMTDMAGQAGDDLAMNTGDGGSHSPCATYKKGTIAEMRMPGKAGCFEIDDVLVIAKNGLNTTTMYVQNPAGGDYSAMQVHCSDTSTSHPCTVYNQYKTYGTGAVVSIQGSFIKSASMPFESFYIDTIQDGTIDAAAAPAAVALTAADVAHNGMVPAKWWMKVAVNVAADPLKVYDFSPPEYKFTPTGGKTCPQQNGFAMIPSSALTGGVTQGPGCSGMTQPAKQANPAAQEIIIGTDFYFNFKSSSDCACAATQMDTLISTTTTVSTSLQGILIFDNVFGTSVNYQAVLPTGPSDFQ